MNSVSRLSVVCLLFTLLLISCEREAIIPQMEFSFYTLEEYFESNRTPEVFAVSPDQDISITGSKGTVLYIPQSYIPAGTGELTISFREYLSRKDLILANLNTEATGDRLLESGGSFYLDVRDQMGGKVDLLGNVSLTFPVSESLSNSSGMTLWEAGNGGIDDFQTWNEVDESLGSFVERDAVAGIYYAFSPSFNWINIDQQYLLPNPVTSISVNFPDQNTTIDNTSLYLVSQNANTVSYFQVADGFYESFYAIGEEISIVAIHKVEAGTLKYNIVPLTVTENMQIDISLMETTEAGLEQALVIFD